MLISHSKQFIFTKTVKTAGTSIESYFEKYCMPDGEWERLHHRDAHISTAGIVGCRKSDPADAEWYNHMSAQNIRNKIGYDAWDRYFKFTAIRNPFDKLISGFFMFRGARKSRNDIKSFRRWLRDFEKAASSHASLIADAGTPHFLKPIELSLIDRDKYLIDGTECVDYYIRFEHLHRDIRAICDKLSIPYEIEELPEFKKGVRHYDFAIGDYFDQKAETIARNIYAWEIERFGYDLPG